MCSVKCKISAVVFERVVFKAAVCSAASPSGCLFKAADLQLSEDVTS